MCFGKFKLVSDTEKSAQDMLTILFYIIMLQHTSSG